MNYFLGISIWNYNENLEMSYSGVYAMKIYLDGKPLTNINDKSEIFLLRRAPGNENYNYVQMISFCEFEKQFSRQVQKSYTDFYNGITGFVIQIVIYSTWGDKYYCGLNGIKVFDDTNTEIPLQTQCE